MNELRKAVIENMLIRFKEWPDLIRKVRSTSDENIIEIAAALLSSESYINQMDKIEEILEIV